MTKSDKIEAKVTHRFMASPEQIFHAWLDPQMIRAWMAKDVPGKGIGEVKRVEVDPRVGGRFVFSDMRAQAEHARARGSGALGKLSGDPPAA